MAQVRAETPLDRNTSVWYSPKDSPSSAPDYMRQFSDVTSWSQACRRIAVYKIAVHFALNSSDDDLRTLIAFLKARKIKLALEFGVVAIGADGKGAGIEGYDTNNEAGKAAARIKNCGGTLDYLALDEPLYYGYYFPGGCQYDIPTLAKKCLPSIRAIQSVFPQVQIGDIEPVYGLGENWRQDIADWFNAYRTIIGQPLAFFHQDQDWTRSLTERLPDLCALLAEQEPPIPFGMIFNARDDATSSSMWMLQARINLNNYYSTELDKPPSHTVIQYWTKYPEVILPESSPEAFVSLVNMCLSSNTTRPPAVPFYRIYNSKNGHLYTANAMEKQRCVKNGWIVEGIVGGIFTEDIDLSGLVPLYRLVNDERYAYTTRDSECKSLLDQGYHFAHTRIAGYVFPPTDTTSRGFPLYGVYSASARAYFYTKDQAEYKKLLSNGWQDKGVVCYLMPSWRAAS